MSDINKARTSGAARSPTVISASGVAIPAPAQYSPVPDVLVFKAIEQQVAARSAELKRQAAKDAKKAKKKEAMMMKKKGAESTSVAAPATAATEGGSVVVKMDEDEAGVVAAATAGGTLTLGTARERDWLDRTLLLFLKASPAAHQTEAGVREFLDKIKDVPLSMEQKPNEAEEMMANYGPLILQASKDLLCKKGQS